MYVASHDSSDADRLRAGDYVCGSSHHQEVINAALQADRGEVVLLKGSYDDLRKLDGQPYSILMNYDYATLRLEAGALLRLADDQKCNVIQMLLPGGKGMRVYGRGVIDPNAAGNPSAGAATFDWLDMCGVKIGGPACTSMIDCGVDDIDVQDVTGIGVYLFGIQPHCRGVTFGGAVHDQAELCTGEGGDITGCKSYLTNGKLIGHGVGVEAHSEGKILNNSTIIGTGAVVTNAVHRMASCYGTVISGNTVRNSGGTVDVGIESSGYETVIVGNRLRGRPSNQMKIIANGATNIGMNALHRVDVYRGAGEPSWPIRFDNNQSNAVGIGPNISIGYNGQTP